MSNTLDLLSLEEAKAGLNLESDDAGHDLMLAAYVTAFSAQLDELCGPIIQRTITAETHDGGRHCVFLKHAPLASVSSVTEYALTTATTLAAESNTAKTTNDYHIDLNTGALRRRANNRDVFFAGGRDNISVTYVAGRYASTAMVESKWKLACQVMLSNAWRREQAGGTSTFGGGDHVLGMTFALPRAVEQLLRGEMHAPFLG